MCLSEACGLIGSLVQAFTRALQAHHLMDSCNDHGLGCARFTYEGTETRMVTQLISCESHN